MSESKLRRYLKRRADSGNWFVFYRAYMKLMPRITSIFLQDLMNLACSPKAITEEIDGKEYFLCTIKFLENSESEWSEEEQSKQLEILQGKETKRNPDPKRNGTGNAYIHICRKGAGAPRWIYIDYEKLEEDLDVFGFGNTPKTDPDDSDKEGRPGNTPESDPGIPPNQTREYPRHNKKKKEEKEIPRNSPTANPGEGDNFFGRGYSQSPINLNGEASRSPHKGIAADLYNACLKHGKLGVNAPTPERPAIKVVTDWSKWVLKLLKYYSVDQVQKAVRVLIQEFKNQYFPRIRCGKHLYEKFDQLLDAIDRKQEAKIDRSSRVDEPQRILSEDERW